MAHRTKPHVDVVGLLSHMPLFQELGATEIGLIAAQTRERHLARGEVLFHKGDRVHGFYLVIYGQIKLAFPAAKGNEKVFNVLEARASFGEALMFLDRHYPHFAEAVVDSLLLFIPREVIFDLLEENASFARVMIADMSIRMHDLLRDIESYSLNSGVQRVIGYLLQQCPDTAGDALVTIDLPLTKQLIASRLNLTPETLSRIFSELSRNGVLTIDGKQIVIHHLERLREYAS